MSRDLEGDDALKRWEARAYMCTWLAQPYTSSVVSVLISVTTDMSPTGDLLVTSIFAGEVSSRACSGAFMCCAGMALSQWQHTLWGNRKIDRYIYKVSNSKKCGPWKFDAEGV